MTINSLKGSKSNKVKLERQLAIVQKAISADIEMTDDFAITHLSLLLSNPEQSTDTNERLTCE